MRQFLSERWVLLADVSNTTRLFWELIQARSVSPNALFQTSVTYAGFMETIFQRMQGLDQTLVISELKNTMGDGFLLVGREGHGMPHIVEDGVAVLGLARAIKLECDELLADSHRRLSRELSAHKATRELPELRTKVVLHHGYTIEIESSGRLFGDTINFAARIASEAFREGAGAIVVTQKFADALPDNLVGDLESFRIDLELRYPEREQVAYRIPIDAKEFWNEQDRIQNASRA